MKEKVTKEKPVKEKVTKEKAVKEKRANGNIRMLLDPRAKRMRQD